MLFVVGNCFDAPYMEYFVNTAGAEDELYKKWKEITLNSTSDQTK